MVIIGAETGKILYLAVKNVYCSACEYAKRNKTPVPDHRCYRNYKGSASGMEQEAMVEGFRSSLEMHGLIYKYYIGDGDSSCISGIKERVQYGRLVHKIECANHLTRNFSQKVHALVKEAKKYPRSERVVLEGFAPGDTIPRVDRLVTGARGAIDDAGLIQAEQDDKWTPGAEAIAQLEADLTNLPMHVLGQHSHCSTRYCQRKERGEKDVTAAAGSLLQDVIKLIQEKLMANVSSLVFNRTTNDCER